MSLPLRHSYALINLDALRQNVRAIRQHTGARVMAVVKSDAYGHGAKQIAAAALESGATELGVATADEALELREDERFRTIPILVMAPTLADEAEALQCADVAVAVGNRGLLRHHLAVGRRLGRAPKIHVQLDTGIGRDGIRSSESDYLEDFRGEAPAFAGLFAHFAVSDGLTEQDEAHTRTQTERFLAALAIARRAGFSPEPHLANSGAVLRHPSAWLALVRPGMMLYGVDPANGPTLPFPLAPVLSLRSRLAAVRLMQRGETISYGRTWTVPHDDYPIGIVPLGYGDGYHRSFSGRGEVLVSGRRAPIRGRVCMDQFMVDLSGHQEAKEGDEVVLYGRQGAAEIKLEEASETAGTIPYELTCALTPRIPRVYHG
jgi:alanine racemase